VIQIFAITDRMLGGDNSVSPTKDRARWIHCKPMADRSEIGYSKILTQQVPTGKKDK